MYELHRFTELTTQDAGKLALFSLGNTRVLYTPLLGDVLKTILDQCLYTVEVTVFTLDLEFVHHLCRAQARGCKIKVLLDLQQCLEPSCRHHAVALRTLKAGNVALRCPRFDAAGMEALHLKQ